MATQADALKPRFRIDPDIRPAFDTLRASVAASVPDEAPYRHWIWRDVLPDATARELAALPFPKPDLHGVSGKRELHNDTRHYFDAANARRFAVCDRMARLFQAEETVALFEAATGADLSNTNVRIEYTLDADCFWLEPHTDLGVKRITILYYLPDGPDQRDLGTDIYQAPGEWHSRPAFDWNSALVFVPGSNTYHGFEKRDIPRVRRTVIVNYVTQEWRAREQLSYPAIPVGV
ncbi:MAG TPA: hypothetical protein VMU59_04540 [Caulobacteraceae bacterium]|nr:hypothetical protein [Caulobacteraceae bacterium]